MVHAQTRLTEASQVAGTAVDRIVAAVEVLHEDDAEVADLDAVALCAVDALDALGAIRGGAAPTHAVIGRCVQSLGALIELLEQNPSRSAKVLGAIAIVARAFRMLCRLGATLERTDAGEAGLAERRQEPRVPLQVTVGLQGENNFFTGYTEDISDGGVFVATYEPLPVGTSVGLVLLLPHGRRVSAAGDVVWIRAPRDLGGELSPGMGIELRGLREADRGAILAFVAERTPLFYDC
jgi:uncharacterized protein (TIGR02266 family)